MHSTTFRPTDLPLLRLRFYEGSRRTIDMKIPDNGRGEMPKFRFNTPRRINSFNVPVEVRPGW